MANSLPNLVNNFSLKEFIELNLSSDMMIKKVEDVELI